MSNLYRLKSRSLLLAVGLLLSFLAVCTYSQAQTIRKNYREMTAAERQIFVNALNVLRANGRVNAYAVNHLNLFNSGIHGTEDFLPWHRWFARNFEVALINSGVAGANKIALPYWDWTSEYYPNTPTDRQKTAPLWDDSFLGQFNSAWSLGRTTSGSDLTTGSVTVVNSLLLIGDYTNFRINLEGRNLPDGGSHGGPHPWVGTVMGGGSSPNDPAFYLHHNNVERPRQIDWFLG
jgi:Common central domain of tyrosinase